VADLGKYSKIKCAGEIERLDLNQGSLLKSFIIKNESQYNCIAIVFPDNFSAPELTAVEKALRDFSGRSREPGQWVRQAYWCEDLSNTFILVVGTLDEGHKGQVLDLARRFDAVRVYAKEGNYFYSNPREGKVCWDVTLAGTEGLATSFSYDVWFANGLSADHRVVEAPSASTAALQVENLGYTVISLERK